MEDNNSNHSGDIKELSVEDIEKHFGTLINDKYIDERIEISNKVKALLNFWHENNFGVNKAKEGYLLAKSWKDDNLVKRYIDEGKPFLQRRLSIEEKLKEILPKVKGVRFLHDSELVLLPIWMLEAMEIKIEKEKDAI